MIEELKDQKGEIGLSFAEAKKRLEKFGLNQIIKTKEIGFFGIAKEEITEPMILLLLVVGFIYGFWGKLGDAITIFSIIFILILVEAWNEYRAKKRISSLSKIVAPKTKVLREGKIFEIKIEEVVPGDILILIPGTRISADSKLLVSFSLQVDESSLTGESFPQEKKAGEEIYAGTLVISGEGKAEVFATGKNTKIGKISSLVQKIKEPKTPLQLTMNSLAKNLVWIALFFSLLIPLLGFLRGQDFRQMILTGLSLAFATVPEELPIIISMVLGLGAYQLSKENFLVKKIKAAEILGNATVIITDKTGTITENKMQVVSIFPEDQDLKIFSSAKAAMTEISLSPTDKAILEKTEELKIEKDFGKIVRERTFGNSRKTRALLREINGNFELFVSGAPEETLSLTKNDKDQAEEEIKKETVKGRRVIAIAQKTILSQEKDLSFPDLEKDLNFVGLIALEDPPRKEVAETIRTASLAGIRTIMVTGDHPQTAAFISKSVGISSEETLTGDDLDKLSDEELRKVVKRVSVFARATPEHKYRLVKALRENKEVVAVTGDGVNDTLALKAADIGIAMGIKGADAAKEAADVVLADDNFVTISRGIFEGRKFFDNLRKGVKYYLSCKTALILIFLLPTLLNIPLPFAPIQIILLEFFMDIAASSGFVSEPAEKTIYTRQPRELKKKFLNPQMLKGIAISGLSLFAAVTVSYFYARWQNLSIVQTQTFAFSTWMISHIILAFVSRSEKEPLFNLGLFSNKVMNFWAAAAFIFLFIVVEIPALSFYFKLSPLTIGQLGLIIVISFLTVFWQEFRKIFLFRKKLI